MDKHTKERVEETLDKIWKDYTLLEIKEIIKMMNNKLKLSNKTDKGEVMEVIRKIVSGCDVVRGITSYGFIADHEIDMYIRNGKVLFYIPIIDNSNYLHINGKGLTSNIHKQFTITRDDKLKMVYEVFNEVYGTKCDKAQDSFQSWVFKQIRKK